MPKNDLWFHRRPKPKEKCPQCGKNDVPIGVPMCHECAKKKPFGDD